MADNRAALEVIKELLEIYLPAQEGARTINCIRTENGCGGGSLYVQWICEKQGEDIKDTDGSEWLKEKDNE